MILTRHCSRTQSCIRRSRTHPQLLCCPCCSRPGLSFSPIPSSLSDHLPHQRIESAKMRLTAELIQNSLSYLNPLKERELDLRGALKQAEKSRYYTCVGMSSIDINQRGPQDIKFPRLRTWAWLKFVSFPLSPLHFLQTPHLLSLQTSVSTRIHYETRQTAH